jgi:hypothetical protein
MYVMPSGRLVVTRDNAKSIRSMRAMFITPWYTAPGVSGCPTVIQKKPGIGIMASGGAGKLHRNAGGDHALELHAGLVNPDDSVILVVDPNDRVGVDILGIANEFA